MKNRIATLVCTLLLSNAAYAGDGDLWVGAISLICMANNAAKYQDTPLGKMFLQSPEFLEAVEKFKKAEDGRCLQQAHVPDSFCSELFNLDPQSAGSVGPLYDKHEQEIQKVFESMQGKHC